MSLLAIKAAAQSTAFSYQGRLNAGLLPANGVYDLRFTLFDSAVNGNLVAGPVTNAPLSVSNGLFLVSLDFGGAVFDGSARWLEIAVRTNGTLSAYNLMAPRQFLGATPYAVRAATFAGPVADAQLSTNIARLNGNQTFSGNLQFNNLSNIFSGVFKGDGAGLSNLVSGGTSLNGSISIGGVNIPTTLLTNGLISGNAAILTNTILPGAIWSKWPVPPLIVSSFVGDTCNISQDKVKADLDSLVTNGFRAGGWTNYSLEDGQYQSTVDADNNLVPDPVRFPNGFPYIIDYAHANGFCIGSYISGGSIACCPNNNPGTPANLMARHIKQIVDWGFDGLTMDECGVADPIEKLRLLDYIRTFNAIAWDEGYRYTSPLHSQRGLSLIAAMNDGTGGGIPYEAIYSVNVLGMNTVPYVTAGDQANMLRIGYECIANQQYVGPGHYLDPTSFDCSASSFRDYTAPYPRTIQMMISIYAMCAAPMQIDSPNHYNDSRIWADLNNRGPLNILQDRAVVPCWIAVSNVNEELWVRPLGGITPNTPMTFWRAGLPLTTSNAFLYFNKTTVPRSFDLTAAMLDRANALGNITIQNAWSNTVDGAFGLGGHFTIASVPANRFYLGVASEAQTFAGFSGSSASFAAALTDKTGSGPLVFAIGPTLASPNLLNAKATSIINNGVGASKVVVTDANGKEIGAALNGLTLSGATLSASTGAQTPWTSDINGAGFRLTNVNQIAAGQLSGNGAGITNVGGIRVYRSLVSQASTSAPTDTVLENSLGGVLTWSRTGVGAYTANLSGAFPAGKTMVLLTLGSTANGYVGASSTSPSSISVTTYDGATATAADGKLAGASFQILVYP